jgi:Predicted nucleic acid-binding protein, contains PIN domain
MKPNIEPRSNVIEHYVLDAWAILAFLKSEEPASIRVRELLLQSEQSAVDLSLSIINLGEVYYRLGKLTGPARAIQALNRIRNLRLTVVSASDELVMTAAELKMKYPLAYADAFAAALAHELDATLVTGDPELAQLQGYIKLEMLHRDRRLS